MDGWTFWYKGKDVFIVTDRQRKTKKMAREICHKLLLPDAPSVISDIMYYMQKGELITHPTHQEIKTKGSTIVDPTKSIITITL